MPSVSKQQQKFFGLVRALQKGDVSPSSVTKKARDAAKDMKKSDVKKYAATKHKGLPRKVRGETKVRELIKKMVREILDEQKLKQLAVIRSSQPQSPYTIFQDGNGFVMKGGRGFSLSFKDENTISKNTKSLKDYLNRVLGYWSYQKGKIKGINEEMDESLDFGKVMDKYNKNIVDSALSMSKKHATKDKQRGSKQTPKLIAIKTINRMKEYRNKTKGDLKVMFQKTIDKLEKDYKKIKEGKLKEINKSHFMDMVDGEIDSLKGQIAYAQDAMKQKGVEDWEKKEYKAVLKDAQRRLKDKLSHKKRLSKLGEGKLKENRKEIAQTILQQLGGNKFIAMTGAKNLGFDSKGSKTTLSFKIGKNSRSINYVKVDYISGKDLYDMSFFRLRAGQLKLIKKVSSIYGDQLQKFFTKNTGLYTRL